MTERKIVKCIKCDHEFETTAKTYGRCRSCKHKNPINSKNIVRYLDEKKNISEEKTEINQQPEKEKMDKESVEKYPEQTPKIKDSNTFKFSDILDKFKGSKPVTEETEDKKEGDGSEHPNLTDTAKEQVGMVQQTMVDISVYMGTLFEVVEYQFFKEEEIPPKLRGQLVTETLKICSVYLSVKTPDENDIKPLEVPAWAFALVTVGVLFGPMILKKIKKKKGADDGKKNTGR